MNSHELAQPNTQNNRSIKWLTWLLDESIRLPGGVRIGIDGFIGLIPGLGDLFMAIISGYIILHAQRSGASKSVILRMFGNVAFETLMGAVPILGDLFDFYYKANVRNLHLLQEHQSNPEPLKQQSQIRVILYSGAVIALTLFLFMLPIILIVSLL